MLPAAIASRAVAEQYRTLLGGEWRTAYACHPVGFNEWNAMHDHLWRDNWIEFKARLIAQWEHLTYHELDAAEDKREHVLRHIELREGVDRPEAERRLREVETKR